MRKNIAINSEVLALINQAQKFKEIGKLEQAVVCYQEVLKIGDLIPEILFNYGNLLCQLNRHNEAIQVYRQALIIDNHFFPAHLNLANCLRDKEQIQLAIEHYYKAILIQPKLIIAYRNLTRVLIRVNRFSEAIEVCKSWLKIEPDNVYILNCLGFALQSEGQYESALKYLQTAVEKASTCAESLNNLGTLLNVLHRPHDALPYLRRCVSLDPNKDITQSNLIETLLNLGLISEALKRASCLLKSSPHFSTTRMFEGFALTYQARISEAIAAYQLSWEFNRQQTASVSNALFSMLYSDRLSGKEFIQLRTQWVDRLPNPTIKYDRWQTDPNKNRPLKVGYLSADLHSHPVSFFFEPILANHNSDRVTSFCYSSGVISDDTTSRLKNYSDNWIDCRGWNDRRLAQQIYDDRIDILVDLSGHTSGNRVQVLKSKPAPIQMVYIGYPDSTGLKEIDYIISDRLVSPRDFDYLYTEQVLRISGSFWCFRPPDSAPEINQLPALDNGYITFGSFNNSPKLSQTTIRLWSKILKAIPNSRLLLKAKAFQDPDTCDYFGKQFQAWQIERSRIVFEKPTFKFENFLKSYHKIDIALDSFPYNGGTTTCQSLWMGVPVISLRGQHFFSRMSYSFLTNVELQEFCGQTEQECIDIALNLNQNLNRLSLIRSQLRQKMKDSSMLNGAFVTQQLETLYHQVWLKK